MNLHHHIAEKIAGAGVIVSGATAFGARVAEINEYLQAGAYVVAIVSGLAATIYYLRSRK